ncbi:hypothetical protein GCM10020254_63180 [Streptomyces goshikiensis]
MRAAVREPALRPYALLWLAEHDGVDPDDAQDVLTAEESTWLWVDTAAAIADHGEAELLARHLDSAVRTTVPRLLDEVRAVGHPRTVQVLVAPGGRAPRPGAGQGGAPGRLPGPHRRRLGDTGARTSVRTDAPRRSQTCGAYVPKLQMLPSPSRAM